MYETKARTGGAYYQASHARQHRGAPLSADKSRASDPSPPLPSFLHSFLDQGLTHSGLAPQDATAAEATIACVEATPNTCTPYTLGPYYCKLVARLRMGLANSTAVNDPINPFAMSRKLPTQQSQQYKKERERESRAVINCVLGSVPSDYRQRLRLRV